MTIDDIIEREINHIPDRLLLNRTVLKAVLSKAISSYLSSQKIYLHRDDKAKYGTCKCDDCAITKRELEQVQKERNLA